MKTARGEASRLLSRSIRGEDEGVVRYYVVCTSAVSGIAPHIIAEVVRDHVDDDGNSMLAFALADDHRVIATRGELLEHPLGRAALEAWDAQDDGAFDDECVVRNMRTESRFACFAS